MKGVILAAGRGSRLNGTAGHAPKCLVKAGGITLLERQIRALTRAGVDDIVVVVGCEAGRVKAACGRRIAFVENVRFAETNSLYSLWMARPLLHEGFVVLNCDVLFHPALLDSLLASRHDAALLVAYLDANQPAYGDEEMKVKVRCGRVVDMSKTMAPDEADGENVGIAKFGPRSAPRLVEIMDAIVTAGSVREWAPRAFRDFAQERPLHAIGTRGYPWIEIDFPDDYVRALRDVLPAIEESGEPAAAAGPACAPSAGIGRGL